MLIAFCVVILFSQISNFKVASTKFSKVSLVKQSTKGPSGSMTNENQSNPIEEEDDDDFKIESTILKTHRQEFFIIRHYSFQEDLIRDPHREIFSPPPQI